MVTVRAIALDALRRQAAGPIVSITIVTSRSSNPRAQALSHAWSPGTARAGIPQARAEIMSGGPSAVLRPFAGAGRPCAFTTAPPETRGGDLRDGPARGIDGTAAVALAGPL